MLDKEINKFIVQKDIHWGDPFYLARKSISGYVLANETWEYAKSKSKSIGILLEIYNSNRSYESPFCLVIYTSGKLMSASSNSRIFLNELIKSFILDTMNNKLNTHSINFGQIIFFDELLYLVERGSLLLFSWSKSQLEWIQTPILYLFNTLIKNRELFKLSNYISFSRMRRSGYKFVTIQCGDLKEFQDIVISNDNAFSCVNIEKMLQYGINIERIRILSSVYSDSDSYLINNSETKSRDEKKKDLLFISKQPHENFLIKNRKIKTNNNFIVSVISINSEIRLNASVYRLI